MEGDTDIFIIDLLEDGVVHNKNGGTSCLKSSFALHCTVTSDFPVRFNRNVCTNLLCQVNQQ